MFTETEAPLSKSIKERHEEIQRSMIERSMFDKHNKYPTDNSLTTTLAVSSQTCHKYLFRPKS